MNIKHTMIVRFIAVSALSFAFLCFPLEKVSDSGKLYLARVDEIIYPTTTEEIQKIVLDAQENHKKISIAGARYSQGAQSHATNSINIDLKYFNKLIKLDAINKTVTVQTGMTWEQLQNILHSHNLSIKVMQSSNVFSIGGSLSVNVHGRDPHYGSIIETVISCTIIDAQGNLRHLSRTENSELFSLAIGGYGLFGIITEVELQIIDNVICFKNQETIHYQQYSKHLENKILINPDINLYFARLLTVPGKNYLKQVTSVAYIEDHNKTQSQIQPLKEESDIHRNQLLFNFYRKHQGKFIAWLRHIFETKFSAPWETGEFTNRNQLMRPYIHCLKNENPQETDLLQEYFIPVQKFAQFTDQLRIWSQFYNIKLLNVTLRWLPKNTESFLSYAQSDMIAFVLYFSTELDTSTLEIIKLYTHELTQACLDCKGTFYLPYQQFASQKEVHSSYPMLKEFIQKKNAYDPSNIFTNNWYENYIKTLK